MCWWGDMELYMCFSVASMICQCSFKYLKKKIMITYLYSKMYECLFRKIFSNKQFRFEFKIVCWWVNCFIVTNFWRNRLWIILQRNISPKCKKIDFWYISEKALGALVLVHWNEKVAIWTKFSPWPPVVITMTTSGAASDEKFVNMTTFTFEFIRIKSHSSWLFGN